jgi:hypothetical protein
MFLSPVKLGPERANRHLDTDGICITGAVGVPARHSDVLEE